jgi:hypothetical protein
LAGQSTACFSCSVSFRGLHTQAMQAPSTSAPTEMITVTGWTILEDKHSTHEAELNEHSLIFQSVLDLAERRPWFDTGPEVDVHWLDGVTVEPVTVIPRDIQEDCRLVENPTPRSVSVDLQGATFLYLEGNLYRGNILLEPLSSRVLLRQSATGTPRSLIRIHSHPIGSRYL